MYRCLTNRETTEAQETHFQRFDDSHGFLLGSAAPTSAAHSASAGVHEPGSNAIKHSCRGDPKIEVTSRDNGDVFEFCVSDNGAGIAKEFHEKIWGIFQTLEARDRVEGTGIGLSVVRKIVQNVGGQTWVDSAEGQGARFFFTWPKA